MFTLHRTQPPLKQEACPILHLTAVSITCDTNHSRQLQGLSIYSSDDAPHAGCA